MKMSLDHSYELSHEVTENINQEDSDNEYRPGVEAEDDNDINRDDNFLPKELVQQLSANHVCLVCLGHIRDIVCLACGHLLFCQNCVIFYQRCPVCGVNFRAWLKVLWDIQ